MAFFLHVLTMVLAVADSTLQTASNSSFDENSSFVKESVSVDRKVQRRGSLECVYTIYSVLDSHVFPGALERYVGNEAREVCTLYRRSRWKRTL